MTELRSAVRVVATRAFSGGIAGRNHVVTVHADGTLRLSDPGFGEDETRKVPRARLEALRSALARPEWQEVEPFYGQTMPDGFSIAVEGGGRSTGVAHPSAAPAELPPILDEVLGHLNDLWPIQDDSPTNGGGTGGSLEPNLFQLRGRGVRISYGVLRSRGEFLDYKDGGRELTFSGEAGEIDSLDTKIGRMLTVSLNPEEAAADADLITLTLLLPEINPKGQGSSFETVAIRTTHLTGFRPGRPEGPQKLYEALPLKGTASQVE